MSMTSASAEYFKTVAASWDELREGYFSSALRDAAMAAAYLRPDDTVADVGGGTGFLSAGLAPRVAKVHLIDGSAEMIAVARKNLAAQENIEFHLAEGSALPLEDQSTDAVLANMYLHHCRDPLGAIHEMARILKPGGRTVITDLVSHDHEWLKTEMGDEWLGFDTGDIQAWMRAAGLVNLLIHGTGQSCCASSQTRPEEEQSGQANIGIFMAVGARAVAGVQAAVREDYGKHALGATSCCGSGSGGSTACCSGEASTADGCCQAETGAEFYFDPGYTADELANAPTEAAEIALGCGNPLAMAKLSPGETVVDIGSGGGIDAFLAARKVGPAGKVIGVDMTPAMLRRARQTALKNGYRNVQFREGRAEALPVGGGTADVVMSNCVINLTVDKGQVFEEIFRVLKPGGRLEISDMVSDGALPASLREDAGNWAGCVYGALPEQEYLDLIRQAGFEEVNTRRGSSAGVVGEVNIYSLQVSAVKPERTCGCGCEG